MAEREVTSLGLPPVSDELRDFLHSQELKQLNVRVPLAVLVTLRLAAQDKGISLQAHVEDQLTRVAASQVGNVQEAARLAVEQAESVAARLGEFADIVAQTMEL